ncbi:apolipoprotein N-acyltransferase [Ideonella sp. BN130291]|uniref:apolipoprotein N-acyltransferase n=1 Tax=Ideonella sp. BN130291 TaxID=3112940 RepID=UPI002E267982|nr:apolipoprotein N-acyltransferase [Ideonella sp. BN130291]
MSAHSEGRPPQRGPVAWLLALLAGVLHTASFAPTEAWPLQILALAGLAALAHGAGVRRAAALGWWFGFGWLASGLWWLYISMHRYGGMAPALAAAAVVVLAAVLALYYALALGAWARWCRVVPGAGRQALAFAAIWLLAELARGVLLTGFPWIAGGYAHTTGPLAAWAPWVGVYGIGALAAWLGAALALALAWPLAGLRARVLVLGGPLAALLVGVLLPADFTLDTGRLSVTLLQPNVAQDQKFEPANVRAALQWHQQRLAAARGTLVLTPESSIPLPSQFLDESWPAALRTPFAGGDRAALVGIFLGDDAAGYTNSLIALSRTSDLAHPGSAYHYGKRHLLPFGEYVPPGFKWFVDLMHIPIGDQAAGRRTDALAVGGQRVRPVICYEDLFGEDMVSSVVGDQPATVFANATNLAWFGPLMVQDQHLQFSRMRALEFQRPMVRATNTGITGVVDHRGVLTARLPSDTEGALEAEVHGRTGATPYARWLSALGLWPLAVLALAVLLLGRRR